MTTVPKNQDLRGTGVPPFKVRKSKYSEFKIHFSRSTTLQRDLMGTTKQEVLAAFKLFDKDGSGSLDAQEFKAILTRPGEAALSDEDAQAIINDFDTNGDGVLQFKEFVAAWSKLCGKIEANEEYQTDMYDRRVEPHKEAIARIFGKLDKDKSGDLSGAEVEEVISLYQGAKYDHDEFMGWYDTHGGNPNGTWDVKRSLVGTSRGARAARGGICTVYIRQHVHVTCTCTCVLDSPARYTL